MSAKLRKALRRRYPAPGWALLFEVPNGTGGHKSRVADAVAMGLWPSRGLHLHGFELKAYRSDWLRELKNPKKAETVAQYCDLWWLVTEPDVARVDEIPDAWGWLELQKGGKLRERKKALMRGGEPLSRSFLAALLRAASAGSTKYVLRDDIEQELSDARKEGKELGLREARTRGILQAQSQHELVEKVKAFEAATGISISKERPYRIGHVGAAVNQVLAHQDAVHAFARKARQIKRTAEAIVENVDALLEESCDD